MKKLVVSIIVLSLVITGCINKKEVKETKKEEVNSNSDSVVIYFSATGNTEKIAKRIAKQANSDIIEIVPKDKYEDKDLDYNNDCRANKEQNDPKARPKIKNKIDISKYDVIYLGYPIWWGTNPKIILTLLDSYDFTDKVIFPFCTSGSTDIDGSISDLRKYNSKLTIKDGKRFVSNSSEYEIIDFVDRSNIEMKTLNKETSKMKVIIEDKEYTLNLEDNAAAKTLLEFAPFETKMEELNGNEKYVYLSNKFPIDSYKPGHIEQGDVMLFDNSCLVIFYKSFDTPYSYTKIGYIDNLPNLGDKSVNVKFEE